jgi:hypothetical protein
VITQLAIFVWPRISSVRGRGAGWKAAMRVLVMQHGLTELPEVALAGVF